MADRRHRPRPRSLASINRRTFGAGDSPYVGRGRLARPLAARECDGSGTVEIVVSLDSFGQPDDVREGTCGGCAACTPLTPTAAQRSQSGGAS